MKKELNFLPESHIQVSDAIRDWREALLVASQPLIDEDQITMTYVKNMEESVEKNGPYMVLTDYFALMHARPGEGVNEQSMGLLVTKNEIDLEGKKVKIFLVLAAEDSESHLESLQALMAIFMDEKKYQMILNGNRDEIIQIFRQV